MAEHIDLQADLEQRWRPSDEQIAAAEVALAKGSGDLVFTIHLLANKHFGFWDAQVEVISCEGVFAERDDALAALEAQVAAYGATHGVAVTGGYTVHRSAGRWAVLEDICALYEPDNEHALGS